MQAEHGKAQVDAKRGGQEHPHGCANSHQGRDRQLRTAAIHQQGHPGVDIAGPKPACTIVTPVIKPQAQMPGATLNASAMPVRNAGWRKLAGSRNMRAGFNWPSTSALPITLAAQQFGKGQAFCRQAFAICSQAAARLGRRPRPSPARWLAKRCRVLDHRFRDKAKRGPDFQRLSLPKRVCPWEGVEGANAARQHLRRCSDQSSSASCLSILAA